MTAGQLGSEPSFPPPDGRVALWIRGTAREGLETAFTLHEIGHLSPRIFRDRDHPRAEVLTDLDRMTISASQGISVTYLGRSLDVLARSPTPQEFRDEWNRSHPGHRARSVCAAMAREEVLRRVLDAGIEFSECDAADNTDNTDPCGDCFGCFEIHSTAAAIGREVEYELTPRIVEEVRGHLHAYLDSGFVVNHRDAMQRLVRLRMLYGSKPEPTVDRH